jgi:hypothetical protein
VVNERTEDELLFADRPHVRGLLKRRQLTLSGVIATLLAPLGALCPAAALSGCAALLGEEDIGAWFLLIPRSDGTFFGWTEFTLSSTPGPDDEAVLRRVVLQAPATAGDLRFLRSVAGEAVRGGQRTLLVQGSDFPAQDTLAPLDVVHEGGLSGFFEGDTLRIEWRGSVDPSFPIPPGGMRIDATVTIEIL